MITTTDRHCIRANFPASIRGVLLFFCGCLLMQGVTGLRADTEDGSAGIQMSVVGLGALPESLSFQDGTHVVVVPLPKSGRGAEILYKGASPLVLFEEKTNADGTKTRVPRAAVTYSADWKKVLVVLIAGDKPDAPFRAMAFDDSREGFPTDHVRLFNFFPSTVAISADGGVTQLPAGESQLLPFPARDPYGRIWLKLAVLRSGKWEGLPIFITQVKPDMRLLMLAYEQRNENGGMETIYRTITETLPPPVDSKAVAMR